MLLLRVYPTTATTHTAVRTARAPVRQRLSDPNADAFELPPDQVEELRDAFTLFDKDGSGTISATELDTVLSALGQRTSPEELAAMLDQADVDGDGEIDFPEFLAMMAKKMRHSDPDFEIKEAFAVFSDGDEFIPEDRIREIMENLGEKLTDKTLQNLILEADHDGDGKINYSDFEKTMKAKQ